MKYKIRVTGVVDDLCFVMVLNLNASCLCKPIAILVLSSVWFADPMLYYWLVFLFNHLQFISLDMSPPLHPPPPLTLGVCGTADDVGDLGLEAGVGGAVLAARLVTARAQRDHTLQRSVGPQVLTLVDGQCCGVVDQEPSILKHRNTLYVLCIYITLFHSNRTLCWGLAAPLPPAPPPPYILSKG